MSTVESSTITTKKFLCPKTGQMETTSIKKVSRIQPEKKPRTQSILPTTYPIITDCTGLTTCGIRTATRAVITYSWKDCPFNITLKTR